ncbi:Putative Holin-X, holin superfamily III [Actinacidiphila yanglinensis]|uniref:Putative Holin-X, holin superfamily III n=1 Tax=Actinacidiphila yanglinensis TaxID=310779 RepID=A0A1H6EB43_9ACTN|nr:phage holin family protein [Actinacidiphila yanglinensis]SEG94473.1 Putative Holin-X, holin superfamily III [Actinacidiphila yanglinensis]
MSPASNGDERSLGELFSAATAELSALVHDEIALAKTEIRQDAKRAAVGSGALIMALAALFFAVPVGSVAAALGIHALGITLGWSFFIVFGAYLLIFAVLALLAYGRFKKVKKPERSIDSAKKTAAVLQKAKPHARPVEPQDAKPVGATAAAPALESKM